MARTSGRPVGVDRREKRKRILRVARACFTSYGYSGVSLAAVADAAELTPASIYFHFGNKRALLIAVAEETRDDVLDRFRQAVERESTFVAKVRALLAISIRIHRDDPQLAAFVTAAEVDGRRHAELTDILQ